MTTHSHEKLVTRCDSFQLHTCVRTNDISKMSRQSYLSKYVCSTHPDKEPIDVLCDVICSECGLVLMTSLIQENHVPSVISAYSSKESAIINNHQEYVEEILQKMHLLDNVLYDTMYYFREIVIKNLRKLPTLRLSQSDFRPLSIACIGLAAKRNQCGVRVKDILMFCEYDIASKGSTIYQQLLRHFNIKGQFQAEWFVERYCKSLFPEDKKQISFRAEKLCLKFIKSTRRELRDREGFCVATLALYIAVNLLKQPYQLCELTHISGASEETLKTQFSVIRFKLSSIFNEFSEFDFTALFPKKISRTGFRSKRKRQQ